MNNGSSERRAVITGMGVVAPNGQTLEDFWHTLRHGLSAADVIKEFDPRKYSSVIGAEIRNLDCSRYLDAKKLRRYDRSIRYGVTAACRAVEDAGVNLASLSPDRVGVVEGTTVCGFESLFKAHVNYLQDDPTRLNPIHVINGYAGEGSSVVARELHIQGHSITLCSGCASSNDAIGYARNMIRDDDADVMIVGGADANLLEPLWASYCSLGVMTKRRDNPQQAMRPFDKQRDGLVLGDGAGCVVVEELAHALGRGAKIYAEVLGHGRSCEAHHAVELHPEGIGIQRALHKALRNARLHPTEVDYINAHGSSTRLNDPIESRAIQTVFGAAAPRLAVSATKPITGHTMGAAGVLESIICALTLHHQEIPPTINLEEPDEGCELDYVPHRSRPYPVRVAINLNAGFGGKNSCLVLGRYAGPSR
ncbi:MAG: beta-ketoacyl-[acyl-carrier-protein] synthase family protein [Verrucomicrobia bacterium]|nr:beta-ketoacyl-[acyl-carrier-protein] synthase family protein [Verrucomicrobiota bacterium]